VSKLKVGIVGCGVIGSELAKAIEDKFSQGAEVAALCDIDEARALRLSESLTAKPQVRSIEDLVESSPTG